MILLGVAFLQWIDYIDV